ncbi:ribonuclease P Rpr2/Rpp21/SNM1 subunit family protein [Clostridium hydrogenum]|uniref:hypothetical protein n=1 Tax=Clostridium hydrogenum TaxID=2855764 RepID=UPI001F21CB25|nr:hypothetical protein [Clostridium hydrogenum]
MNKFASYFKDSYGWDKLSSYLSIIGIILCSTKFTAVFGVALIVFSTIRSISKNKYRRYQELQTFESFLGNLKNKFSTLKYSTAHNIAQSRQYKIFKCPKCSQKLRVPRKQGKVVITCKKCGTEFKKRT